MNATASRRRTYLILAAVPLLSMAGSSLAHHAKHSEVKVDELARRDIVEQIDGHDAGATVVEVTFEPGQEDVPHTHAGPVFGYVIEGEYEHALDDEPIATYTAGDTFYEPSGCIHRVARNPSDKGTTRLLAVILGPRDAKWVTVPQRLDR